MYSNLKHENRKNSFLKFTIISLLINFSKTMFVFPFKSSNLSTNIENNAVVDDILFELNKNQLYTSIEFGTPSKNIDFFLSLEIKMFAVLKNYCPDESNSSYIPENSKHFIPSFNYNLTFSKIIKGKVAEDNCNFYYDLNITNRMFIHDFKYLLGQSSVNISSNNKYCGILGLYHKLERDVLYFKSLVSFLKSKREIDSYSWGIFYFDKEKSYNVSENIQKEYVGILIVGITENDYLNIFNTSRIINDYGIETDENYVGINYQKIFFYKNNEIQYLTSNYTLINFVLDNNYNIFNTIHYNIIKDNYFQKYIEKNICSEKISNLENEIQEHIIICESKMEQYLNTFPTLYFFNREYEFTFNLDYKDLFTIINNKIYFLIIGRDMPEKNIWSFGKMFMKKYPFMFNEDKKTISFVYLNKFDKNEEKKDSDENEDIDDDPKGKKEKEPKISGNNKALVFIFIFIGIIFGIIIGIILGRKLWKKRKQRANELDENVEYNSNDKYNQMLN